MGGISWKVLLVMLVGILSMVDRPWRFVDKRRISVDKLEVIVVIIRKLVD
jgi:hypothetical protein